LGIILFSFSHIKINNLHWEHLPSARSFGETSLILFFAFVGFETSLGASGEIKDPKRTIPRAVMLGGICVFMVYILLQTITQGVLGGQIGVFKNAPLAAVAQNIVGPIGATILLIGAIISCLGNVGGDVLATPRLLFAGAKDGLFPKYLGKVHKKFATPYWALVTYAGLIFIFATTGGFEQLAIMSSCILLLIYLAVILAMLRIRTKKIQPAEKSFKVRGGLIIPFIAIASIIYLLAQLPANQIIPTIIFIATICVIYFLMKWFQKKKSNNKRGRHNAGSRGIGTTG